MKSQKKFALVFLAAPLALSIAIAQAASSGANSTDVGSEHAVAQPTGGHASCLSWQWQPRRLVMNDDVLPGHSISAVRLGPDSGGLPSVGYSSVYRFTVATELPTATELAELRGEIAARIERLKDLAPEQWAECGRKVRLPDPKPTTEPTPSPSESPSPEPLAAASPTPEPTPRWTVLPVTAEDVQLDRDPDSIMPSSALLSGHVAGIDAAIKLERETDSPGAIVQQDDPLQVSLQVDATNPSAEPGLADLLSSSPFTEIGSAAWSTPRGRKFSLPIIIRAFDRSALRLSALNRKGLVCARAHYAGPSSEAGDTGLAPIAAQCFDH